MDAKIWGPKLWFYLHTITFEYPDNPTQEDKDGHYMLLKSLKYTLPCKICKNHYINYFDNNPLYNSLDNKEDFIRWVLNCHNNVNKLNNKPEWTYEMLIDKYANIYKASLYNYLTYKNLCSVLVVMIIILIYLYYTK